MHVAWKTKGHHLPLPRGVKKERKGRLHYLLYENHEHSPNFCEKKGKGKKKKKGIRLNHLRKKKGKGRCILRPVKAAEKKGGRRGSPPQQDEEEKRGSASCGKNLVPRIGEQWRRNPGKERELRKERKSRRPSRL